MTGSSSTFSLCTVAYGTAQLKYTFWSQGAVGEQSEAAVYSFGVALFQVKEARLEPEVHDCAVAETHLELTHEL
jgi:hypothetical protein